MCNTIAQTAASINYKVDCNLPGDQIYIRAFELDCIPLGPVYTSTHNPRRTIIHMSRGRLPAPLKFHVSVLKSWQGPTLHAAGSPSRSLGLSRGLTCEKV